jgi:sedoheptulose-bisphosphatase
VSTPPPRASETKGLNPSSRNTSYVSPRQRAKRTLELLGLGTRMALPWQPSRGYGAHSDYAVRCEATIQVTAAVREWDYGEYEGLTSAEIRAKRAAAGLPGWDIWAHGCPGGE